MKGLDIVTPYTVTKISPNVWEFVDTSLIVHIYPEILLKIHAYVEKCLKEDSIHLIIDSTTKV